MTKNSVLIAAQVIMILIASVAWILAIDPFVLYCADNIYAYSFMTDLFTWGNLLRDWKGIPHAPYFFPDFLVYGLGWMFTRSVSISTFTFNFLNLLFLCTGISFITTRILLKDSPNRSLLGFIICAFFIGAGATGTFSDVPMHWLFMGHSGIVNLALVLCVLVFSQMKNFSLKTAFWITIFLSFSMMSDRLIEVEFMIPLFLTTSLIALIDRLHRKWAIKMTVLIALCHFLGRYLDWKLRTIISVQSIDT